MTRCWAFYKWVYGKCWGNPGIKDAVCELCAKDEDTVDGIIDWMEFCDNRHPECFKQDNPPSAMAELPERAARAFLRISDEELQEKAVESVEKFLESGKDPFTGRFVNKEDRYTVKWIKRVVAHTKGQDKNSLVSMEDMDYEYTDIWNFTKCDPHYGFEYPGRVPGQILKNILYYWATPGAYIVDPFAGSGTSIDVCNKHGYHCRAYDLHPVKEEIVQHDVLTGFPSEAVGCDLIFLDPPYWKQKHAEYKEGSISAASYSTFIQAMGVLAEHCRTTVRPEGLVCLLMQDTLHPEYHPTSIDCFNEFRKHLTPIAHISVPVFGTSQLKLITQYRLNKQLIGKNRDLWVFRSDGG